MKISFLVPHFKLSGGMVVVMTYARFLAEKGHDVCLYTRSKNKIRRFLANHLNLKKPDWVKSNKIKFKRISSFNDNNISSGDISVAFNLYTADCLNNLSKKVGKKFFSTQHDEGLFHFNQKYANQVYQQPVKKIVVSTWLREILKNKYNTNSDIVLNTVDRKIFYPRQVNRLQKTIRILLLHHNLEWKGTNEGVEMVEKLQKKYPNVRLVIFGARAKKIDIPNAEYYYRPIGEKLAGLYSSCDIFLCPSWYEGFGLPSLEAMACKCAVATYDNGGSRDFAFDNRTAMVARQGDKIELMNKLEMLIKDRELRNRIADGGYGFAQKLPIWEKQVDKLEQIFLN